MHWPDLSPLEGRKDLPPNYRAVGWLSRLYPFAKGPTSALFRQKLQDRCWLPIRLMRGFHQCEFCSGEPARGNGEIDIPASTGEVYVAPAMVIHYVETHDYRPPDAFIEAVEQLPKLEWAVPVPELSDRVRAVAENRTPENWDAFVATFLKSRVGVRASALREPPVGVKQRYEFLETKSGQKVGLSKLGVIGPSKSVIGYQNELTVVADFENGRGQDSWDFVAFAGHPTVRRELGVEIDCAIPDTIRQPANEEFGTGAVARGDEEVHPLT
jgi:hypothetical protein